MTVKNYSSHLVKPKVNTKGIIFIIHNWNGLNKFKKSRADMQAEEGYIGVALDLLELRLSWIDLKIIEGEQVVFINKEKNLEQELIVNKQKQEKHQ